MQTLIQAGLSNALSATMLAILVLGVSRLLRDRPAVRHALWLLVLIKLVTPPLYLVPVSWRVLTSESAPAVVIMRANEMSTDANASATSARFWEESSDDRSPLNDLVPTSEAALAWLKPLIGDSPFATMERIWLVGTLLVLGLSVYRIVGFRRVVQAAEPVTDDVEDLVDELAARIGLAHSPSTRWIAGKFSPMVWALPGCRPRLLIPIELWKTLDRNQRSSLVAHELAHLRRGDHHVRLLEIGITALYWWNPLVWCVRRALRDAEEQCCDAWVVWTFPESAKSYAETLLETLDFLHPSDFAEPLLSSGLGKVDHLRKRLTMIMTGTSSRGLGASGLFGLAAVASLLLPIHPTWAGKAEDEKRVVVITGEGTQQSAPDAVGHNVTITSGDTVLKADTLSINVGPTGVQVDRRGPTTVGKIHLTFKSGDGTFEIETDSIDEAIKILEVQKAKAVNPVGDKHAIGVVDSMKIETAIENLKQAKQLEAKTKKLMAEKQEAENKTIELTAKSDLGTFYMVRNSGPGPVSPEAASKVAKAAERVEAIAREVESKQLELQKATRELEMLSPPVFTKVKVGDQDHSGTVKSGPVVVSDKIAKAMEARLYKHNARETSSLKLETKTPSNSAPDQQRIAELEAKLQKLVDEVNSLKKDQKPGTQTLERSVGPDGRPIGVPKR